MSSTIKIVKPSPYSGAGLMYGYHILECPLRGTYSKAFWDPYENKWKVHQETMSPEDVAASGYTYYATLEHALYYAQGEESYYSTWPEVYRE